MRRRRDAHLPWRWLVERADGTLTPADAAESDRHLAAGCATCAAADAAVARLRAALAAGPLETPPAVADRRVLEFVRRLRDAASRRDVLVGTLVLDRRADEALALRSSASEARRLLWTMPGYEVDASLVPARRGADLLGQLVPDDDRPDAATAGEVRLLRGGRVVARSALAADGRFTFRGVARGLVEIEGVVDGVPFLLPGVVVD